MRSFSGVMAALCVSERMSSVLSFSIICARIIQTRYKLVHNGSFTSLTVCFAILLPDGREGATVFTSYWPHSHRSLCIKCRKNYWSPIDNTNRWAKLFLKQWSFESCNSWSAANLYKVRGRHLSQRSWKSPFLSAFELKMASNFPDSPLTAMRRLRERGIRSRRTATKEHLKIDHIVDLLA